MTTDQDGFLQNIAKNPNDNWCRLVYADWLDEHGENEKCELIRVQCDLHELRKTIDDVAVSLYENDAPRYELVHTTTPKTEQIFPDADMYGGGSQPFHMYTSMPRFRIIVPEIEYEMRALKPGVVVELFNRTNKDTIRMVVGSLSRENTTHLFRRDGNIFVEIEPRAVSGSRSTYIFSKELSEFDRFNALKSREKELLSAHDKPLPDLNIKLFFDRGLVTILELATQKLINLAGGGNNPIHTIRLRDWNGSLPEKEKLNERLPYLKLIELPRSQQGWDYSQRAGVVETIDAVAGYNIDGGQYVMSDSVGRVVPYQEGGYRIGRAIGDADAGETVQILTGNVGGEREYGPVTNQGVFTSIHDLREKYGVEFGWWSAPIYGESVLRNAYQAYDQMREMNEAHYDMMQRTLPVHALEQRDPRISS